MNYTVVWTTEVLNQLAAVWVASSDQAGVTAASYRLEQDLAQDPSARGVRRNASVNRTAVDLPLGIDYEIIEDDKRVRIVHVWAVG